MDNAVALVQAFLRLHGYPTVTEFPVVRTARGGGQECLTDLDVLAFRFGEASGPGEAMHHPGESEANALLRITGGVPDMIIGEVKEGRAELNDAATRHDVLTAALERFGCCRRGDIDGIVHELLRHGPPTLRCGHGRASRLARAASRHKKRYERTVLRRVRGEAGVEERLVGGDGRHVRRDQAECGEVGGDASPPCAPHPRL